MMLWIDIHDKIDAKALWNDLEPYRINETDMIEHILVYGDLTCCDALKVLETCMKYSENMSVEMKDSSS